LKLLLLFSSFSASIIVSWISLLPFYIVDRRILAYQWHLCTRRHVKYPGSANISRNARNVFRVPEPPFPPLPPPPSLSLSLSLSFTPFPFAAVFPQWTIFTRTVECTSLWTFYGTCFMCVRAFLSSAIFMFSCSRAQVRDQSYLSNEKKENRDIATKVKTISNSWLLSIHLSISFSIWAMN